MKTKITFIKTALVAGLILTTLLATPNNAPLSGTVTNETEKTIRNFFKFPQILMPHMESKSQSSKVEVLFTTDRSGRVNFVLANTQDRKLKAEIEKQFSTLYLAKLKQDVVHRVVLNFRTL